MSNSGQERGKWEEVEDSFCYYLLIASHHFLLDYKLTVVVESCKQQCKVVVAWSSLRAL